MITIRRVARIWKRGGLFWKSEKCANDLDWNFHWSWINFRRFVRNLRRNVSESSEIQRFFPPKIRWSPKKKKKKRPSPKLRLLFHPISQIQTFEGGLFSNGGAIFHFSQKIGLKSTRSMRFCILHKPMGELEPPPPPLATLLITIILAVFLIASSHLIQSLLFLSCSSFFRYLLYKSRANTLATNVASANWFVAVR